MSYISVSIRFGHLSASPRGTAHDFRLETRTDPLGRQEATTATTGFALATVQAI